MFADYGAQMSEPPSHGGKPRRGCRGTGAEALLPYPLFTIPACRQMHKQTTMKTRVLFQLLLKRANDRMCPVLACSNNSVNLCLNDLYFFFTCHGLGLSQISTCFSKTSFSWLQEDKSFKMLSIIQARLIAPFGMESSLLGSL